MALASADVSMSIISDQAAGSYRARDESPSRTAHNARNGCSPADIEPIAGVITKFDEPAETPRSSLVRSAGALLAGHMPAGRPHPDQ